MIIGKKYLDFLNDYNYMPRFLRIDRGTETGIMAAIHSYLIDIVGDFNESSDSVIYGKSPTNKIERWWRDLHERLEKYFKQQLNVLLTTNAYDPHNERDRKMLGFIYVPIIQRECDIFAENWNDHKIRKQKGLELPVGKPSHMFNFPENFGGFKDGFAISNENLREVAEASNVLEEQVNYLNENERQQFEAIVPHVELLNSSEAMGAYLQLKNSINSNVDQPV